MLRNGYKRIDTEIRKWWRGKRPGHKSFGDPGGDSVGDLGTVKKGRRRIRRENAGEGVKPMGLSTVADCMEGYLGEGSLVVCPGREGLVDQSGETRLIDWSRKVGRN
jgi:hypothetical protein